MSLADDSYTWYRGAAIGNRRVYKVNETLALVVAAAIPVSAAIWPGNTVIPAVLGAIVVVMTGARTIFHSQENYLRFSRAREAVEAERRLYRTGSAPYDDVATRDAVLAANVTAIEREEMGSWIGIASQQPNISSRANSPR
ncbi:DUF4231 domain-containing protein [Streptomyces sp. NPDC002935]|uniref:DUF4231 domain-containing protein n=1 Tax=Streptomyces sp. NPDC002935 TaxID=3154545 RepID=UPI0033B11797